jgi:hypothetical protein
MNMPARSHWPDRTQPFAWEKSEVIDWIQIATELQLKHSIKVFEFAKDLKAIVFDSETKLWHGNPDWNEKLYRDKRRRGVGHPTDRSKDGSP